MSNAVSAHNSLRGKRTGCQNHLSSSRQYNKGKQPLNTTWKAQVEHYFFFFFFLNNLWKDSEALEQVIQKGSGVSHLEIFQDLARQINS